MKSISPHEPKINVDDHIEDDINENSFMIDKDRVPNTSRPFYKKDGEKGNLFDSQDYDHLEDFKDLFKNNPSIKNIDVKNIKSLQQKNGN
jgi:hypothetical protein